MWITHPVRAAPKSSPPPSAFQPRVQHLEMQLRGEAVPSRAEPSRAEPSCPGRASPAGPRGAVENPCRITEIPAGPRGAALRAPAAGSGGLLPPGGRGIEDGQKAFIRGN